MENTYLDYFNYYLKEFCNEIVNNFPEAKTNILANYRLLLEGRDNKSDIYCKYFLNNVNEYIDDICSKREEMFNTDNSLNFLVGVNFADLWRSEMNNTHTKQSLWKYLQLLSHLSRNVVPELEEISELLSRVGGEIEAPAKMLRTFDTEEAMAEAGTGSEQSNFDMLNAVSMVSNLFNNGGTTFDNIKGLLSGVLKGIGFDGIEETLEKFNINEIIADLGLEGKELSMETIQEVMGDPEKMKTALNKLTENLDTCGEGEGGGMIGQVLMMMKQMMAMFNLQMPISNDSEDDVEVEEGMGNTTSTISTEGDNTETHSSEADNTETHSSEADNTETRSSEGDNTEPLGDMFSNMMKAMMNNDAINKMAADMEAGKQFNPMDMLSGLMGNKDVMNMAKNMAKQNPGLVKEAQRARGRGNRDEATRARLRAKLAAKKKAETGN
jgi:hypothetical protein